MESLLAFHSHATVAADDAATEWARRQLEAYRPLVANPDDLRKIDLTTDRPDRVNPQLISAYINAMQGEVPDEMERFVTESVASKDANPCMAALVHARDDPHGIRLRWVRQVLEGVEEFPDSALAALRALEATARDDDREAALAQAEFASALATSEAKLADLEAPSDAELARRAAIASKPAARPGEPIGLAAGPGAGPSEGEGPVRCHRGPPVG